MTFWTHLLSHNSLSCTVTEHFSRQNRLRLKSGAFFQSNQKVVEQVLLKGTCYIGYVHVKGLVSHVFPKTAGPVIYSMFCGVSSVVIKTKNIIRENEKKTDKRIPNVECKRGLGLPSL